MEGCRRVPAHCMSNLRILIVCCPGTQANNKSCRKLPMLTKNCRSKANFLLTDIELDSMESCQSRCTWWYHVLLHVHGGTYRLACWRAVRCMAYRANAAHARIGMILSMIRSDLVPFRAARHSHAQCKSSPIALLRPAMYITALVARLRFGRDAVVHI